MNTPRWLSLAYALVLTAATAAAHSPCLLADFVALDDGKYVFNNEKVANGLTLEGTLWAWTQPHAGFWIPLTWHSFQIDATLGRGTGAFAFGIDPLPFHLTNLVLHTLNTLLAWRVVTVLTGSSATGFWTALLWALHPARVESVAWVTERKDVLSLFFGFLAILAYDRYVRAGSSLLWYLHVTLCFTLSLLAKSMLASLPFLLLLLDYWPYGRLRLGQQHAEGSDLQAVPWMKLAIEKLPWLALGFASLGITWWAHVLNDATSSLEGVPLDVRLKNSVIGYADYLGTTFWPLPLSVEYPLTLERLNPGRLVVSFTVLAILTFAVLNWCKRWPFLFTTWFWFAGTLVPVIGLTQQGRQCRADRFLYFPQLGLLLLLVHGLTLLVRRHAVPRAPLLVLGGIVALLLGWLSHQQTYTWRDTETMWEQHRLANGETLVYLEARSFLAEESQHFDDAQLFLRRAIERYPEDSTLPKKLTRVLRLRQNPRWVRTAAALMLAPDQLAPLALIWDDETEIRERMEQHIRHGLR